MGKFIKGDIVVIPFPFSDLSTSKRRPALVLADPGGDDIILCQITSQNVKDDKAISVSLSDVEKGSLNVVSNVRPNKLFTADESIVAYKIGKLRIEKINAVVRAVIRVIEA
ncbi:MAG: type II toxin-antitoxin system PemK/MazF family toxin [Oscillospiraceae bacterium]|nr:type II toxin-antitoxin system PemK/MazF family toxin [Oscillospiraceae bacterium]